MATRSSQKQSAIAKTIRPPATDSVIAGLAARTTAEAANAPAATALRTGKKYTGQYLFDRFVASDKAEVTKLEIVRGMVEALPVDEFKKVVNDFVGVATGYRDNAIKAAKAAGKYDKENPPADIAMHMARVKTALNHQTVMRVSYGALKFCPDDLARFGYTEATGYLVMQVIARKALDAKGLKWDGTKADTKADDQRKASAKAEKKALDNVMSANPRGEGETMAKYVVRCSDMVADQLAKDNADREAAMIHTLAIKVRKLAGGLLDDVIAAINAGEGVEEASTATLDPATAQEAAKEAVKH